MSKPTRNSDKTNTPYYQKQIQYLLQGFRQNLQQFAVILFASVLIFFLVRPQVADEFQNLQTGTASPRTIYAPFDFEYIDELATQNKIEYEASRVNPVYKSHPNRLEQFIAKVELLHQTAKNVAKSEDQTIEQWVEEVLEQSELLLSNHTYLATTDKSIPATAYECLYFYRDFDTFWNKVTETIETAEGKGITDNINPIREIQKNISTGNAGSAAMIQIYDENGNERATFVGQEIFTFENFLKRFELQTRNDFPVETNGEPLILFAMDLVKELYTGPTLTYDAETTQSRVEESKNRIESVVRSISKGEVVVGYNDIITKEQMQIINVMVERFRISAPAETGYFLFSLFFVLMIIGYLFFFHTSNAQSPMTLVVIFSSILLIFACAKVCTYLSFIDIGSFHFESAEYGVPMGALGVILTVLFDPRLAIFCCSITSIYTGLVFGGQAEGIPVTSMIMSSLTSWGAIYSITRIRQRSDLYRAGGVVIVMASILVVTFTLFQIKQVQDLSVYTQSLKWALVWGAINGCLVSILSISLLPIFEDMLGITTDIKLLELSQRNELLQKLEHEAPGSYQHTMRVATLAESAAEAIGANTLLTRVGTYYHDIGKTVKPLYFVENQQTKADKARHSKISINMSCMIIRNHVKHGIEIAKQYKLPKSILDFIPEHHGTTLMTYFYHEALAEQEKEGTVKEEDFRYPGPKPQSKETAIVMLSDALEATSRVLENVSERDIRQLVRKIINDRFMDGQFDECNLTLQDLHTLYQSFSESLMHTLHQRIVYPDKPVPEKSSEKPASAAIKDKSASHEQTQESKPKEIKSKESEPVKQDTIKQEEQEEKPVAIKQK